MLDITDYDNYISTYGGSEIKRTYFINNKKYMVKFPDPVSKEENTISYINNQYSEYIGCKVFELFNIDVQKVELVKCKVNDKIKVAVMCEDFLKDNETLVEFKNLAFSLDFEKKYTNEIKDIFKMIKSVDNLENKENFEYYFWKVFIVDTLIGNTDRHLGNFALINKNNNYKLSPIYDCGSCLHPIFSEDEIIKLLKSNELKNISINLKTAYKSNGKTLNYLEAYQLMPKGLKNTLTDMYHLIDMDKIKSIIDSIPLLTKERKEFYYKTICFRKTEIIDKYYNLKIKI